MKFEVAAIPGMGLGLKATADIRKGELVLKERRVGNVGESSLLNSLLVASLGGNTFTTESLLKSFVDREIKDCDKPAVLALNDPDPTGPEDMKLARCFKNSVFADGLFLTCARMNHSCLPAVQMSSDDEEETEVRALRDILAGEEITVSYLRTSALQGRAERVAKLLAGWNFQCCCQVCKLEGEALTRGTIYSGRRFARAWRRSATSLTAWPVWRFFNRRFIW